MTFKHELLPSAASYFDGIGLKFKGPANTKWRTTECRLHGGSDSMRVNTLSGGWICMSCGAKGGDVLSYQMQAFNMGFMEAAKALGAWVKDGKPQVIHKPTALPPRAALEVLSFESTIVAVAAGNLAKGIALSDTDHNRLMVCAGRINKIVGGFV